MKTYDERSRDIRAKLSKQKKRRTILTAAVSTLCCFALLLGVWGIPKLYNGSTDPTDLPDIVVPGYDALLQKLTPLVRDQNMSPELGGTNSVSKDEIALPDELPMPEGTPVPDGSNGTGSYEEVTDNQVKGVTEADLIKRSDEQIFYLRENTLNVYSIEGAASRLLGSFTLESEDLRIYTNAAEMYLSQDCTTVTIITSAYSGKDEQRYIYIQSLDVTDPEKITPSGQTLLSGSYNTSRLIGDELYLVSSFYVDSLQDQKDFLPGYGTPEEMTYLPMEDIFLPDVPTAAMYTVISCLDAQDLEMKDSQALLSYSGAVYVSAENIYLTRPYTGETPDADDGSHCDLTEVSRLSYKPGVLTHEGSFSVQGRVKDQYSMDEKDGILRIVTTNEYYSKLSTEWGDMLVVTTTGRDTNASLYCIDLADHSIRASLEHFAPDGESVRSVRFDGDTAYVCTSIVLSDPVFFIDLSDLDDIRCKDTGTIPGYSMSLIDFRENFLMGIGFGENFSMKIEMYREEKDAVVPHCAYEEQECWFSSEYKSYYVDREKQLIGLGVVSSWDGSRYILLHFDGYELVKLLDIPMKGRPETMRAVCIEDYLYVFGDDFQAVKLP